MINTRIIIASLLVLGLAASSPARAQINTEPGQLLQLPQLKEGAKFSLAWDSDAFGTARGGIKTGIGTDSLLSAGLGLDSGELGLWQGGVLAAGAQLISGKHPSDFSGTLQPESNLDAANGIQLSKLWYAQRFGVMLLRAGVMDLNDFFDVNDTATLFLNSSFGITPTLTANVPTATYPDSAWGVMAQEGTDTSRWLFGVFQGDTYHRSSAFQRGAMFVGEHDETIHSTNSTYGLGAWYRTAPRRAAPTHDWGLYANFEQPLGRWKATAFLQGAYNPQRVNVVPAYLGAGIVFDHVTKVVRSAGIAMARAWIRHHAAETSIETTAAVPLYGTALILQPDLQYVIHPSGIYRNALVIGARLHVVFY